MKIYSKVKRYSKKETVKIESLKSKKKFIDHIIKSNNDLQSIVEKEHPIIHSYSWIFTKPRGVFIRMSGSGRFVMVYLITIEVQKPHLKVKKKIPKFSFSIAKTI